MTTKTMKPRVEPHRLNRIWGRRAVIGVPMAFLLLVFLVPFLVVFKISVSEMDGVTFQRRGDLG
jgi:ABC-type spermidine/putrescine transport system permease subunit I